MAEKPETKPTPTAAEAKMTPAELQYLDLAAEFDETHERKGLTYITGEQAISRLNTILGPDGWSFEVMERGYYTESDELWCHGRMTAWFRGSERAVVRDQYGSQQIKRASSKNENLATGTVIDVGFDFKAAATDALKKCAMGIGVGLYLSHKESAQRESLPDFSDGPIPPCSICGAGLTPHSFPDKTWSAGEIASRSMKKFGKVVCWDHYVELNRQQSDAPDGGQRQGPPPGQQRQAAPAQRPAQPAQQRPAAPAPAAANGATEAPANLQEHRETRQRTAREWAAAYARARQEHVKAGLGELEPVDQSQVTVDQFRQMCETIKAKTDLAKSIDSLCANHVNDMDRIDQELLNLANLSLDGLRERQNAIAELFQKMAASG